MSSMKRQPTLICGELTRCPKKNETNSKLVSSLSLLHAVLFLELVYASAGVYQLLLAREIRMALVANFYFDDVGILGRTGLESSATSTYNSRFMIIGMYTLFHCRLPRFIFGLCPCVPTYFTIMRKNSQAICITLVRKLHLQLSFPMLRARICLLLACSFRRESNILLRRYIRRRTPYPR